MAGRIDFRKIETPTEFQQLCERLLARMFPEFHPVNQAGGDAGIDGFATWGDQYFQFTHTRSNVPIKKVRTDLEKVKMLAGLKKWYFLCSQPLSVSTWRFIETEKASCPFEIVIWDGAVLKEHLSQQPDLVDEFFPEFAKKAYEGTQTVREDIKGLRKAVTRVRNRPPRPGDAHEGLEATEDEKQDIRDLIMQLAEEEARRRHQSGPGPYLAGEWGEFNRRFDLSSYDRLPKGRFEEAVGYLKQKLFSRRNNEPKYLTIERERKGIYGIAKGLGWSEARRRELYGQLTGKFHLGEMSRQEIHKVYEAMRRVSGRAQIVGGLAQRAVLCALRFPGGSGFRWARAIVSPFRAARPYRRRGGPRSG